MEEAFDVEGIGSEGSSIVLYMSWVYAMNNIERGWGYIYSHIGAVQWL